MPFRRFVQIGRIALVNYGPDEGKLCTIIDVVDTNRVHVDGPSTLTGVCRQVIPLKRLTLTDLKIKDLPHGARLKTLAKKFGEEDILGKWEKSTWGKKLALKKKKLNMNDFDRFSYMLAKKKTSRLVKTEMSLIKKKK